LEKFEETYSEMQFQNSYYKELNKIISPFLVFDNKGNINSLKVPIDVSKIDKNIFLAYLWKIEMNRNFILYYYSEMEKKTRKLVLNIKKYRGKE
jgi:hypothetical protein